jgi:integrase
MASIKKRTWQSATGEQSAYRVSFTDAFGKRRSLQFKLRKDGMEFLTSLDMRGKNSKLLLPKAARNVTIKDTCLSWLDACEKGLRGHHALERSTLERYQRHVERNIIPKVGNLKVIDFDRLKCQELADWLAQNASSRTNAAKIWVSFRSALSDAVALGHITSNPAEKVRIKIAKRTIKRPAVPNLEEMKRIVQAAETSSRSENGTVRAAWRRYYPFIITAIVTGLRASELRGLRWTDLDLDRMTLSVRQRADEYGEIGPTKSKAAIRDIHIPEAAATALRKWREACPKSELDLVFPNGLGKVESIQNIYDRCWQPLLERAGLTRSETYKGKLVTRAAFRFHSIRHFRASQLIAIGASPLSVQRELGHESVSTTLGIYGHLFPESSLTMDNRMDIVSSQLGLSGDDE